MSLLRHVKQSSSGAPIILFLIVWRFSAIKKKEPTPHWELAMDRNLGILRKIEWPNELRRDLSLGRADESPDQNPRKHGQAAADGRPGELFSSVGVGLPENQSAG